MTPTDSPLQQTVYFQKTQDELHNKCKAIFKDRAPNSVAPEPVALHSVNPTIATALDKKSMTLLRPPPVLQRKTVGELKNILKSNRCSTISSRSKNTPTNSILCIDTNQSSHSQPNILDRQPQPAHKPVSLPSNLPSPYLPQEHDGTNLKSASPSSEPSRSLASATVIPRNSPQHPHRLRHIPTPDYHHKPSNQMRVTNWNVPTHANLPNSFVVNSHPMGQAPLMKNMETSAPPYYSMSLNTVGSSAYSSSYIQPKVYAQNISNHLYYSSSCPPTCCPWNCFKAASNTNSSSLSSKPQLSMKRYVDRIGEPRTMQESTLTDKGMLSNPETKPHPCGNSPVQISALDSRHSVDLEAGTKSNALLYPGTPTERHEYLNTPVQSSTLNLKNSMDLEAVTKSNAFLYPSAPTERHENLNSQKRPEILGNYCQSGNVSLRKQKENHEVYKSFFEYTNQVEQQMYLSQIQQYNEYMMLQAHGLSGYENNPNVLNKMPATSEKRKARHTPEQKKKVAKNSIDDMSKQNKLISKGDATSRPSNLNLRTQNTTAETPPASPKRKNISILTTIALTDQSIHLRNNGAETDSIQDDNKCELELDTSRVETKLNQEINDICVSEETMPNYNNVVSSSICANKGSNHSGDTITKDKRCTEDLLQDVNTVQRSRVNTSLASSLPPPYQTSGLTLYQLNLLKALRSTDKGRFHSTPTVSPEPAFLAEQPISSAILSPLSLAGSCDGFSNGSPSSLRRFDDTFENPAVECDDNVEIDIVN